MADSLRDTLSRIGDVKLRTAAKAVAVRDAVVAQRPEGPWAEAKDGLVVMFDRDPELIRNKAGDVVGIDAMVRAFRAGAEVKVDPHRVIINCPVLVPDGEDEKGERRYREDPWQAYLDVVFDSIEIAPNPRGHGTKGTVTTIFSSTADGEITSNNATYLTARTGSSLNAATASVSGTVGQDFAGAALYICYELFYQFDVSAIPDAAIVTAVAFSLFGTADESTTDFVAEARISNWGASLTTGDWIAGASLGGLTRVATFATSGGWNASGYNTFAEDGTNFRTAVASALTGGDIVYLLVASDRLAAGTAPPDRERVSARMADQTGTSNDPRLVITHNAAPVITDAPTVSYNLGLTGVSELNSPATVTFTAEDEEDSGLDYEIRTATGGAGTLVASGTCISGVPEIAEIEWDDSGLIDGAQTLYLLVIDGDGATDEESFAFTRQISFQAPLELVTGIGGFFHAPLEIVSGIGGWFRASLDLRWEVAPSEQRIAYALSGEFGPVIAPVRFERRTVTNQYLADVTPAIRKCRIEGNNNRTVFRTAEFEIDPAEGSINPLTDHIAVFTDLLIDGNYVLPLQWGLFALTVPRKTYAPLGSGISELWQVGANDNTIHLLEDGPGETWVVAAGQNYITGTNAVASILTSLGLPHALPNTAAVLPTAMSWPASTPWAGIINDLLAGINHYTIKPDAAGVFRAREASDLAQRTPDETYRDTDFILIPIVEEVETTRFANKIIATAGDMVSVATNDDPDSPISTINLGRTIARFIAADSAADQSALDEIAARYIRDGNNLYRRATLETQPDPRRGANEVYELVVNGLYQAEKWAVQSWSVELLPAPNPRMQHTISKVSPVAVTVAAWP